MYLDMYQMVNQGFLKQTIYNLLMERETPMSILIITI